VLLVMVETGLRPSEIVNARAEDLALDDPVPHIRAAGDGSREFKSAAARRDVPLVGASLEAARRHPAGFARYLNAAAGWSAAVNKYLRAAGLFETPAHVVYSLRHSFQDCLTAAEAPGRIQADLMGHEIDRPRYGVGATLEQKRRWVEKIAVTF
jgi:integrase